MQVEPGVLRLGLGLEPVGPHLAWASDPSPFTHQAPVAEETGHDLDPVEPVQVGVGFGADQMHGLPPHPGGDVLLFLAHGIGINRRGAELGMAHPLLEHVQWNAVHRGVDAEPVAQTLWASVRRVRYPGLGHNRLDDLPDPDPAERPDQCTGLLAGRLGLPDAVRGVQRVQEVRRHRHAPVDDLGAAGGILALLKAANGDRASREIHPGRGDLEQLGGSAPGEVERLAERAIPCGLAPRHGQESRALLGIKIEPVPGGVMEAHLAHGEQSGPFCKTVLPCALVRPDLERQYKLVGQAPTR